ncbi:acetate/propionate family kinase [Paracoccus xiamenensis]|uniref:acetate/propionate family kinase n=1 Tax=Paracoccus xiamenensis TaxID=2714901 RepID=UPI00140C147A|nr:acetate/propionate family kinase [Paracoccus xiamenensis]NHF73597.1 acetate/propionate family kinase [Paracoccus xiamenensis]
MNGEILILNAGSSSLKFSIYIDGDETPEVSGLIDRIGAADRAEIKLKDAQGQPLSTGEIGAVADHGAALMVAIGAMGQHYPGHTIKAVGHRVVHGGPDFAAPVAIDDDVQAQLEALTPLAPLHQPHCLAGIRAARAAFPDAVQIACFDTAFHRTMPRLNETYAIPREYFDAGVRRYGFHGLSYDYIAGALREHDPKLASGRVIVAHLGNGASLCAMQDGKSVATTMGFSALDGLAMGTRCGQIDPGVLLYLLDRGMSSAELSDMLYRKSGLLGLSGVSSDMRTLLASPAPEATEAVAYFVQSICRGVAELTAMLGGLDALIFTAGIGENSYEIRENVCAGLHWLGVRLNARANDYSAFGIADQDSRVEVLVIPTREDLTILRAVRAAA